MSGWLGALAGVAGQLGGAYLASQASNRAANTAVAAGDRAIQAQTNAQQQAAALQADAVMRAAQLQADSTNRALGLQADSTNRALGLQADMYNQNRADLQPWRDAGSGALSTLTQQVGQGWGPGSSGYDFQFNEGMRALDSSAASRGMLMSGAQAKAAERFGQGLASTARGEELNRLQALAGLGQTATTAGTGLAQNYANSASGLTAGLGQNLASGQMTLGQNLASGQMTLGQNLASGQTALGSALGSIYGQQGTAAANGITGAAQPWQNAANNIWSLAAKGW